MTTQINEGLKVGDKVRVEKGSRDLGISKGTSAKILEITELGPDYSHQVRVVVQFLNGFKSGTKISFSAHHRNRLKDPLVRLRNITLKSIEVRKA